MERIWYPLAQEWWSECGNVTVRDETGQRLLVLPVIFMQTGSVPTYAYVVEQLGHTYEEEGTLRERGCMPDPNALVQAGEILFCRADRRHEPCTPAKGPRFKYKYRAPIEGDSASTMSNSKRSSTNQSRFRDALLARDGACVVSDTLYESCTAAHILPQSRPEYYDEVLGYEVHYLFMPSYGVLLRDDLHHAFDRGEIAFYVRGEELIVHVFALQDPDLRQYHGKVIQTSRFRGPADRRPHKGLLTFHYRQCAMKYLRGFAHAMAPPSIAS